MDTNVEDLKAFERRFVEIVANHEPCAFRWRLFFVLTFICALVTGYFWWIDSKMTGLSYPHQMVHHPLFAVSFLAVVYQLALGTRNRMFAPQLIVHRANAVLESYNLSIDPSGKLILLNPRQN